jgi:2-amino-4-hydroxy-6-hydroxymethyldihydropteridine diphosphokinase
MWKSKSMNTVRQETVFLGLGSNIGDRCEALRNALHSIDLLPETTVIRCSSVYETEPWGETDQDTFYNAVAEIQTAHDPQALLFAVKEIERHMGRVETRKNGPRRIDIDILLYGSTVVQLDHIAIPHPMLQHRQFVLTPLRELAGEFMHPVEQATITVLASACTDDARVLKLNPQPCLTCPEAA